MTWWILSGTVVVMALVWGGWRIGIDDGVDLYCQRQREANEEKWRLLAESERREEHECLMGRVFGTGPRCDMKSIGSELAVLQALARGNESELQDIRREHVLVNHGMQRVLEGLVQRVATLEKLQPTVTKKPATRRRR